MQHILWPEFDSKNVNIIETHKALMLEWLQTIYDSIEQGDIALSECAFAFISERLLFEENRMQWDTVLRELLTDDNCYPLAYSKQYGKRLFKFDNQWKQTPVHAVYNHSSIFPS